MPVIQGLLEASSAKEHVFALGALLRISDSCKHVVAELTLELFLVEFSQSLI